MKSLLMTFSLLSFLPSSHAEVLEKASIGFPSNILKYCFEKKNSENILQKKQCRTLVITDGAKNNFHPFYERFQKWERSDGSLSLQADAVTYFKGSEAPFDKEVKQGELHEIDLSYPENKDVKIIMDEKGLPTISNIHLGRFETETSLGYGLVTIDYELKTVTVKGEYLIYNKDENGNKEAEPSQRFPVDDLYTKVNE